MDSDNLLDLDVFLKSIPKLVYEVWQRVLCFLLTIFLYSASSQWGVFD